ncbi:MAG: hypothetical protein AAGB12_10070, partial [Pseudomonadota bacterium]
MPHFLNHALLIIVIPLFLFANLAMARFYPPQLEPIQVIGKTSKSIGGDASLAIDDQHKLCIAENRQGLYCYDGTYLKEIADKVIGLAAIDSEENRRLFFSSENKIFFLHNGKITLSDLQLDLKNREIIRDIYEIDEFSFFIATTHALYKYQYVQNTLEKIYDFPKGLYVYHIKQTEISEIEIATSQGLFEIDLISKKTSKKWKNKKIYYIYENFYLTSQGVFNEENIISSKIFYHADISINEKILLSGPSGICYLDNKVLCPKKNINGKVYRTLTDKFNNIWVSTNKGIMFAHFSHVEYLDENTGLSSSDVISLANNENILYIGTTSGVSAFNVLSGEISTISLNDSYRVTALAYFDGHLWVGTHKNGMFRYKLDEKRQEPSVLKNKLIIGIEEYQGNIVVATYEDGVFVFDKESVLLKEGIETYTQRITTLFNCNDNLYISSTFQGIRRLDEKFKASHYTNKRDFSIFSCENENLVTAASPNELQFFQSNLLDSSKYRVASDINSLVYQDNTLWVLHKGYISQWINEHKVTQYPADLDTLYHNSVLAINDRIYAGSPIGLAVIDLTAMSFYKAPQSKILLTTSSDNITGSLIIEPRFNNLAANFYDNDILYRTTNNDTFTAIKHGQSIVFPQGLPNDMY